MYYNYFFLIFICLLFSSCSSVKNITDETTSSDEFQFKKDNVRELVITGKLSSTQKNAASANFKIEIFDQDTLAMSLFGPMGMLLLKFYSSENEFLIYNALAGEAIQGSPASNSFGEFLPIPVKFLDLISLIRNETPFSEKEYYSYNLNQESKEKIFKHESNHNFVEFIVFDTNTKLLKQIQRKSREDKESVNVFFKDYKKIDDVNFPQKIIFDIKKENMQIVFDCENYIINKPFDKSLKFGLPSSVKVNKI